MTKPQELSRAVVLKIEYDPEVLARIEQEVARSWAGPHRERREVGGILLGTHDGDHVRISGFESFQRAPNSGVSFLTSKGERTAFAERVRHYASAAGPTGKQVVGWYRSRDGVDDALSREDLAVHEKYFPESWQVALLVHPDAAGEIEGKLYLKDPTNTQLLPEAVTSVEALPSAAEEIRARDLPAKADPPAPAPANGHHRLSASSLLQTVLVFTHPGSLRGKAIATALALMAVVPLGAVIYLRSFYGAGAAGGNPVVLPMEASRRDSSLELTWDPRTLSGATGGQLDVEDGASHSRISLNAATLASGHFLYPLNTDVTAFKLHVQRRSGPPLEGATMYVGANSVLLPDPAFRKATLESDQATPTQTAHEQDAKPHEAIKTEGESAREKTPQELEDTAEPSTARSTFKPPPPVSKPAGTFDPSKGLDPPAVVVAQATPPVGVLLPQQGVPALPGPQIRPPAPRPVVKESAPPLQIGGRWTLQPGSSSRSPAVPESVNISAFDTNGAVQGSLDAHYRWGSKREHMTFTFSGRLAGGSAHCVWVDREGRHGQIEFIRVPGAPNHVEVVWYGADSTQVFDEIVRKD